MIEILKKYQSGEIDSEELKKRIGEEKVVAVYNNSNLLKYDKVIIDLGTLLIRESNIKKKEKIENFMKMLTTEIIRGKDIEVTEWKNRVIVWCSGVKLIYTKEYTFLRIVGVKNEI